jgi:2-haloacid dehalogenase
MLCVFVVDETLIDLAALDDVLAQVTGAAAARETWFELMIHNALTLTAAQGYRPFGEIGASCLSAVAARHSRTVTPEHQQELGERMRRLPAHPEVADAITRLREAGHRVVTLTNSVQDVAEDQLRNSGLRPLVDAVYSADTVHRLKPAPEPYQHVLNAENVASAEAVLIAAHDWDVAGAAAAGLTTAFVSRGDRIPLPTGPKPTMSGPTVDSIADQLIAADNR